MSARYQRILLKLSGEILAGSAGHGIDEAVMVKLADEIREVHDLGVQIGIVPGCRRKRRLRFDADEPRQLH